MRKALSSLIQLTYKAGVPLVTVTSTYIFVRNKVNGVKEAKTLKDIESEDKRIVVIGGGLAGLTTAYYLANQSPHNKVTLLEKDRKCAEGSSSRNGGLFMTNRYEPWTDKSMFKILPGAFKMTGPQCSWVNSYFAEPSASKFLYYFILQNFLSPKAERVKACKTLMDLSEKEMLSIVAHLKIPAKDIKLITDATLFEMWHLPEVFNDSIKGLMK